jgi:hypothetical protein
VAEKCKLSELLQDAVQLFQYQDSMQPCKQQRRIPTGQPQIREAPGSNTWTGMTEVKTHDFVHTE